MRVPKPDEMRYLVYTTLAYGAQGISYYVYSCAGHTGAIARADGTPTELYEPLSRLNREFVAIARTLQHHQNIAVYHAGMRPPGTDPLPSTTPIQLDPPITPLDYRKGEPVKGVLVGLFAPAGKGRSSPTPTHAVVVNLDYAAEAVVGIRGTRGLETFNAESGIWSGKLGRHVELHLPRGGGTLVRLAR